MARTPTAHLWRVNARCRLAQSLIRRSSTWPATVAFAQTLHMSRWSPRSCRVGAPVGGGAPAKAESMRRQPRMPRGAGEVRRTIRSAAGAAPVGYLRSARPLQRQRLRRERFRSLGSVAERSKRTNFTVCEPSCTDVVSRAPCGLSVAGRSPRYNHRREVTARIRRTRLSPGRPPCPNDRSPHGWPVP